jgi:RNA 2',3'-cyclic 3'-phosphodiesterase
MRERILARIRTFVAFDLDRSLRRAGRAIIQRMAPAGSLVKWVDPENLHLTLKFLGDVPETELYAVCRAVERAVGELEPFRVECRGVGAFPSVERPRTIWLGVEDPEGRMVDLQARVEQQLGALGFPSELRPYVPHITLGRVAQRGRRVDALLALLQAEADSPGGVLQVDACRVYASELRPGGPVYTQLGHALLDG